MILSQTATHAEMVNSSLQYPKEHKNQQPDISVKLRYMNAVVAITAPTRKIALKGITVRPHLKIEIKSFLSQEKWKKNEQNVLNG